MRVLLAAGLSLVISSPLLHATSAAAKPYQPPTAQVDWVTPARVVTAAGQTAVTRTVSPGFGAPVWPHPGAAEVALPSPHALNHGEVAASASLPGMPISVATLDTSGPVGRARVRIFDRAQTEAAGVKGVLLAVRRADGVPGRGSVKLTLDYRTFSGAYGGDWAVRLRLVQLPSCGLTTPERPACRPTALPTVNNAKAGTLSAVVELTDADTMLAAESGPSGGSGDYAATSLQPSATWTSGSNTGEFNWSYPLRTPPGVGGPAPRLELSYSSANVDGRMAASNNQPSWVGEGFELSPGYIERRYKPCSDDMGSGANNTTKTGDQCWATDNATLSLAGHAGELLKDGTTANRWHLRTDDGTYVQHRTASGNGDDNGEWWVVTTADGTQYWFGGRASSNATWTVPVAGNHTGEPCHTTAFVDSFCLQAWRWNLDHVVDQHGNTMSYQYAKETNKYAKAGASDNVVSYDRGGYLTQIAYGTRTGSTGSAPVVADFAVADRCIPTSCSTHNAANWPDTPYDLECTGSPCYTGSPTFWSTKRLASITTKLWTGTANEYPPVTTWTFTHSFPSPGDGTRAGLVLDRISQSGHMRVTTTVPDVTFAYVQLNNRVDPHLTPDHSPPMNWFRIAHITSETGGRTEVTYEPEDCVAESRMPDLNALETNTLRCYPVKWTPPGYQNPIWDFFHKYIVKEVHEVDTVTPGNPTTVHAYEYVGDPAWHYTDDDGLTKAEYKTWSVWRGYAAVRTRIGVGAAQTLTETRYFRGMHGDKLPSGTRNVPVAAVDMNKDGDTSDPVDVPAINDEDAFAGMVREKIVYNGAAEVSAQVHVPWQSPPTATRTINGSTVNARHTGTKETHSRLIRDMGRAPRTTATVTEFDGFGLPIEINDKGDESLSTDDKCTLIDYARNADLTDGDEWLLNLVKRKRQYAVGCARAKQPGLTKADVIADEKTYYDLAPDLDNPPTRGLPTRKEVLEDWVNGEPLHMVASTSQFDDNGRPTTSTDAKGNPTTTAYTHNAGGQLVRMLMTNHLTWTNTTDLEPAFGVHLAQTDPNGRITSYEYDGMGRLTAVWRPGRDKGVQSANETYTYWVRNNAPTVVATSKLLPSSGYLTTYELHDGLLRPRQTQSPRGDGTAGVIVTDSFYDSAGRVWKTYSPYLVAGTPGTLLIEPNEQGDVPQRTQNIFDGAGRTTAEIRFVRNPVTGMPEEHSRQSFSYGGDRVDRTPPLGGIAASAFTDVAGNTTALWQYHGPVPTPTVSGSYDVTSYEYTAKDQLAKVTDAAGNIWTNKYDLRGQKEEMTDPNTGTSYLKHNKYGELESVTDPRGVKLIYTYDDLGRKTGLYQNSVSPANLRAEWKYDELPNSRGQLTTSTRWESSSTYVRKILGFTALYQPSGVEFTIPASETGLSGTYQYFYTYMPDGSAETIQQPDIDGAGGLTAETLRTEYNTLGQQATLKTSMGATTIVSSTAYTGYGELATVTLQNNGGSTVTLARTYAEGTRQLTRLLTSRQTAPTDVADVRYEHDQAGNIQRMSEVVSGDHQCFDYDHLRRLTQAWTPGNGDCSVLPTVGTLGGPAKYWTTWEFDADGNRKKQVEYVTPNGVKTTTYHHPDEPNRLKSATVQDNTGTVTRTWDYETGGYVKSRPNGSATQAISWDAEGHVLTEDTTSFVYDADGNRIIRRDPTGKTLYLPGQELRHTSATGAKKTTRYYTHTGMTVAMRTASGITWLSGDHQGTIAVSITATTQAIAIRRQDPFGNRRTGSGTWSPAMDKGFVGGTMDNTGLTHLGAREYDPVTGRFISPDPLIDYENPLHLDCYGYGFQNPILYSDPNGETPTGDYVWIGSQTVKMSDGEYLYTVRLDFYVMCRNNGTECLASYTYKGLNYTEWWPPGLIVLLAWQGVDVRFKVFVGTSVYRTKIKGMGPHMPQTVKQSNVQRAPYCLDTRPPVDDSKCDFSDFGCLTSDDWHKWWKGNKDWVQGTATVGSLAICAFATLGVCAGAGGIAITTALLGRVADVETKTREEGGGAWSGRDARAMLWGMAIDVVAAKLGSSKALNMRNADGDWNGSGIAGQLALGAVTLPNTWAPWQMGLPLTDPLQWKFIG